jgi:RNA ligase (TIGR02306 family)
MKLATLEKIVEVIPHENADRLEIVKVLGYECVVQKDVFAKDQLIVFIRPDSVLPEADWSQFYKTNKRVRAIKLRNKWSYGLVISTGILTPPVTLEEGEDVTAQLHVTKYETEIPNELNAKGNLPYSLPKTDEENFQNLDLTKYFGSKVDVSLKIDGTSFTAYYKDGEFGVCGRNLEFKLDAQNKYTYQIEQYDLENKFKKYCETNKINLALRGELYSKNIQKHSLNKYQNINPLLAVFNTYLVDEHRYTKPHEKHYYTKVAAKLGLEIAPLLEEQVILNQELINKYKLMNDLNEASFEGVVIKGKDFSFKVINLNYDSRK